MLFLLLGAMGATALYLLGLRVLLLTVVSFLHPHICGGDVTRFFPIGEVLSGILVVNIPLLRPWYSMNSSCPVRIPLNSTASLSVLAMLSSRSRRGTFLAVTAALGMVLLPSPERSLAVCRGARILNDCRKTLHTRKRVRGKTPNVRAGGIHSGTATAVRIRPKRVLLRPFSG